MLSLGPLGTLSSETPIQSDSPRLARPRPHLPRRALFLGGLVAGSVMNALLNPVVAEQLPLCMSAFPLPVILLAGVATMLFYCHLRCA